jgi:hypothetical protein
VSPLFGVFVGVLFFLLPVFGGVAEGAVAHGLVLFLHNIAYSGARIGRKTYLVNATTDEDRALLSAGANTIIGAATFGLSAVVSLITGTAGTQVAALVLLALLLGGGLMALRLDEV